MKFIIDTAKKVREKGFSGVLNALGKRALKPPKKIIMFLKLKEMLKDRQMELVASLDVEKPKEKTLNCIENMRVKDEPYGRYKHSQNQTEPVLYASIYAVLARHLYGDLDRLTEEQRQEWIDYIQSFQSGDGLFKDAAIENERGDDPYGWSWKHLTYHVIMGLTALGSKPKRRFKVLEPFKEPKFVIRWLETRNWNKAPAFVSNEVQNDAILLQYARDFQGEDWADKSINVILDWLDEKQDPKTGLWGNRFGTPTLLSEGVQTGYHLWLLYFWENRRIQYIEKIIDSCLSTQNRLGGFGVPLNSSACEDIDSIDPLVRLSTITDYRKDDILSAMQKTLPWILTSMNEDGGFVFRRMEPLFYGHERMSSRKDESNMFPTWFRTLCLAYIGKRLPDSVVGKLNWQFIKCPGLQFWQD